MAKTETADIFRIFERDFLSRYPITSRQHKVLNSIKNCRTENLGSHVYECPECGHIHAVYNSCRDRHCPKCQTIPTYEWINKCSSSLLNVHYFHVIFTIPRELNDLTYSNQRLIYNIFFKTAKSTLLELSKDSKYLGAIPSIVSILHTWGQNLFYHPHIHFLVSGGGLSLDKKTWVKSRENFFIPVKVLSRYFRKKFLKALKREYARNRLRLDTENLELLTESDRFQDFIKSLKSKEWVVFSKAFVKSDKVVEYFSRYAYRVALSNRRILKLEGRTVYFSAKDYRRDGKNSIIKLDALEFIRRFLLHVLPHRFTKIRYYGVLNNGKRTENLKLCRVLLNDNMVQENPENAVSDEKKAIGEILYNMTGKDITLCPVCKKGKMVLREVRPPPLYSLEKGRRL